MPAGTQAAGLRVGEGATIGLLDGPADADAGALGEGAGGGAVAIPPPQATTSEIEAARTTSWIERVPILRTGVGDMGLHT